MSTQNQLSRYGAISRAIPDLAPGAKVFLVSDSDDTTVGPGNLGAEFPADNDGVARVYTTIQSAVNAATANRGDVVLVLPGYDQSLTAADSWATAGVSVIGLSRGTTRPTLRYTGISGEVGIAANNVRVSGLRFLAAGDSITRGVDFDSGFSGGQFDNNIFDFNATTNNFRVMLRNAQARSVIENNRFLAEDTAGAGKGIELMAGHTDFAGISNNYFYGQFDTVGDTSVENAGAIAFAITHDSSDTVIIGMDISGNTIVSTDTAAPLLIMLTPTACTYKTAGVVRDNRFISYDTATADTASVNFGNTGGFLTIGNLFVDGDSDITERTVGRQAKLVGLQDS
jgi:hypothetical protein